MTGTQDEADTATGQHRCGCCGQVRPRQRLTELGETPGRFICAGCAFWAVRRTAPLGVGIPQINLRGLVEWFRHTQDDGDLRIAIPILPSADLNRTAEFYSALGLTVSGRFDGYLLLNSGPVELHFTDDPNHVNGPSSCFIQVANATKLWKQLQESGLAGVGTPEETSYGPVEFDITDPDGNRIRLGSPAGH
jgi:catechol 2,3-dioxygenase-like lactoylglutathione lyase family enzyme